MRVCDYLLVGMGLTALFAGCSAEVGGPVAPPADVTPPPPAIFTVADAIEGCRRLDEALQQRMVGIQAKIKATKDRQDSLASQIYHSGVHRSGDLGSHPAARADAELLKQAWDERWKLVSVERRLGAERTKIAKRIERLEFWTKVADPEGKRPADEESMLADTRQVLADVEEAIFAMKETDSLTALLESNETFELALVELKLYEPPVFEPQLHWGDHEKTIVKLQFTPDGTKFLSTDGSEARVWSTGQRTVQHRATKLHANAALSPDGDALAILFPNWVEVVKLSDPQGSRVLGTKELRNPAVPNGPDKSGTLSLTDLTTSRGWPIFFSSDGALLFATHGRATWDLNFKSNIEAFVAPELTLRKWREADVKAASEIQASLKFGGDKPIFARWSDRGERVILVSGEQAQVCRSSDLNVFYSLRQKIDSAAADGTFDRIAFLGLSTPLSVVDLQTGQPIMKQELYLTSNVFLTEDGKYVFAERAVYSVERQTPIAYFPRFVHTWTMSADGKRLVGAEGNRIQEWDLTKLIAAAEADYDRRLALEKKLAELAAK